MKLLSVETMAEFDCLRTTISGGGLERVLILAYEPSLNMFHIYDQKWDFLQYAACEK
ncbi:hypothetical protein B566_EDAN015670 [Ephemera danica]|nr:hypothetical protein B566_EDAN015670 [Ephemera danica]